MNKIDSPALLRDYLHALQALSDATAHFNPERDMVALVDAALGCTLRLLDVKDGSMLLVDEAAGELHFMLVHGDAKDTLRGYRFDRHHGIAGWVSDNARALVVNDAYADLRFLFSVDDYSGFKTQRLIAVPMIVQGRTIGVVEALNKHSGTTFTEDDVNIAWVFAALAGGALDYAAQARR